MLAPNLHNVAFVTPLESYSITYSYPGQVGSTQATHPKGRDKSKRGPSILRVSWVSGNKKCPTPSQFVITRMSSMEHLDHSLPRHPGSFTLQVHQGVQTNEVNTIPSHCGLRRSFISLMTHIISSNIQCPITGGCRHSDDLMFQPMTTRRAIHQNSRRSVGHWRRSTPESL